MKYVAKHGLADRSRARIVVEKAYEAYRVRLADHNPSLTWTSDTHAKLGFTVLAKSLSVEIRLTDEEVRVEGDMPLLFRPFQGKIQSVLGGEIEKWIAKAKAGDV